MVQDHDRPKRSIEFAVVQAGCSVGGKGIALGVTGALLQHFVREAHVGF